MGKKSHKRRREKVSPSREEEKSKERDTTKKHRTVKRKKDIKSDECYGPKREKKVFPVVKKVSRFSPQTKEPVYKQRSPKEVKPSHPNVSFSVQDKHLVSSTKTVERDSRKSISVSSDVSQKSRSQRTCDEQSHQRTSAKAKTLLLSEREQRIQKIFGRARKLSRNEKNCNAKTREPAETKSISGELLQQEKGKPLKDLSPKRLRSEAETSSVSFLSPDTTSKTKGISNPVKKASPNVKSASHKAATPETLKHPVWSLEAAPLPSFKIPKTIHRDQAEITGKSSTSASTKRPHEHENDLSRSEDFHRTHVCSDASQSLSCDTRNEGLSSSSSSSHLPDPPTTDTNPGQDEMQVVEELHLARSKRSLEATVTHGSGKLTCIDMDLTEDGAANTHCRQPSQQDLILVLDTNILLSHLDYIKRIRSHGLAEIEFPYILIPWVVLQELDFLKREKDLSGSVAHLAIPAISYIYNTLKNREPRLWGQSMQQAAESRQGLKAENNDDRVLQCCLQYQTLYPECALILCTNDKNLCSKALLCGVKAFSKKDLESEVKSFKHGNPPLQHLKASTIPHSGCQTSLPVFENKPLDSTEAEEKTQWDVSQEVCQLEDCLRDVLADVLEVEMKAVYADLWLEVVYRKPPWTLQDVLLCLKKHWIAVFGQLVQRKNLQLVLNLIDFFHSRNSVDCSSASVALQEAKELVKAFRMRSSRVPRALTVMDSLFSKRQKQSDPPITDVVMDDVEEEESQLATTPVSHREVWALFEKVWSTVIGASMNVFKALGFDPHTRQRSQPVGGPAPPQDAVVFLYKLTSTISQLLQAFSSVLSSAPGSEAVRMLLTVIETNEIAKVDSRFTTKDFCDCFSQQEYREKLRVGGNQLLELKGALDHCAGTITQHTVCTSRLH